MELRQFISNALTEIIEGVADAQSKVSDSTGSINPRLKTTSSNAKEFGFLSASPEGIATVLNFDIALTATEGTDTKGGIGVVSGILNVGTAGASNSQNSSVSRVQFTMPITLPTSPPKE